MTTHNFLLTATKQLQKAGIDSARLDVLLLLEDALGRNRAELLAHPELSVPQAKETVLNEQIARRATHVPLAYIRGHAPFYGREFRVNERVLVPRPESEAMITLLKQWHREQAPHQLLIADIGTGSGCLGVTAALELPNIHSIALCDTSQEALMIALENARHYEVTAIPYRMDLLEQPFAADYQVFLANLPYVPETLEINEAAKHEPKTAIFSGPDGLDHFKRFWRQVSELGEPPACIVTEALPAQHHTMATMARGAGFVLRANDGFAQLFVR
ncbi:MAG TPA: HemK/PrmC family methyltransferase [Candidatus Saccharimonadales bacterium]|nr:HemK/PrmC family methyltransferase [Candidatus Saccharimonadales bacterium]